MMMTDKIDAVAEAIRKTIGTRHNGLPKGGWGGLMKLAAAAAIDAMPPDRVDVTPEMIKLAQKIILDRCQNAWGDGEFDAKIGFKSAVEEALRAAVAILSQSPAAGQAVQDPR